MKKISLSDPIIGAKQAARICGVSYKVFYNRHFGDQIEKEIGFKYFKARRSAVERYAELRRKAAEYNKA